MEARISFRKEAGRPPVFTFRRSDGSLTWAKLRNLPIEHDLAHYAVEQTLRLRRGFYGLLNEGFTPDDFERPRFQRPSALLPANLPLEAQQAEHLVGLLQTEWLCGPLPNLIDLLRLALEANGHTYPDQLTEATVDELRRRFRALLAQWQALPVGAELTLPWVPYIKTAM